MKSKLLIAILTCAALLLSALLYNWAMYGQRTPPSTTRSTKVEHTKTVRKRYDAFIKSIDEYRKCILRKKPCTDEQISNIKNGVVGLIGALIVIGLAGYGYKRYQQAPAPFGSDDDDQSEGTEMQEMQPDAERLGPDAGAGVDPSVDQDVELMVDLDKPPKKRKKVRFADPLVQETDTGAGIGAWLHEEQESPVAPRPRSRQPIPPSQPLKDKALPLAGQLATPMQPISVLRAPAQSELSSSSLETSWMDVSGEPGWEARKVTIQSDYLAANQFLDRVLTNIQKISDRVRNVTIKSDPVVELQEIIVGVPTSVFSGVEPAEKNQLKQKATEVVNAMRKLIQQINVSAGSAGANPRDTYDRQEETYEANLRKSNVSQKFNIKIDTVYPFLGISAEGAQTRGVGYIRDLITQKIDTLETGFGITQQDINNLERQLNYLFGIEGERVIDPQAKARYDAFLKGPNALAALGSGEPSQDDIIDLITNLSDISIKLFDIREKVGR